MLRSEQGSWVSRKMKSAGTSTLSESTQYTRLGPEPAEVAKASLGRGEQPTGKTN
jgi:hypothetical protein